MKGPVMGPPAGNQEYSRNICGTMRDLGPVVKAYSVCKKVLESFYGEFMVLGGLRYGLSPDGDHTMDGGGRGAENAERARIYLSGNIIGTCLLGLVFLLYS